MTYLNCRPDNIDDTKLETDDFFSSYSALLQMMMQFVLNLLALRCAPGGKRGPKTKALLMLAIGVSAFLHGGTRAEKRAFIQRLFARHEETQDRLEAIYLRWRQRKCWMWGGGFRAGSLAVLRYVATDARDLQSFDALIPD